MKKLIKYTILFLILNSFNILHASGLNIFGIGLYDFNKQKNEAIDLRVERRLDKKVFDLGPAEETIYEIKPFYGIEATSDSALYGLAGLFVEEKIGNNFYMTPSFGGGLYSNGDGKDLGSIIEFRSTLEISYELKSKNRIGLSIGHISNASIENTNPGTEILSLSYQTPF